MKISNDIKKQEAIRRMKLMRLYPPIIRDFEENDVTYYCEGQGYLYWLHNVPEWLEIVAKFQKKYSALVYLAELSHTTFGRLLNLFYVSDHKAEWQADNADLKAGYACCYVHNLDDEQCSEIGLIGFKSVTGGVKRIC